MIGEQNGIYFFMFDFSVLSLLDNATTFQYLALFSPVDINTPVCLCLIAQLIEDMPLYSAVNQSSSEAICPPLNPELFCFLIMQIYGRKNCSGVTATPAS